MLILFLLLSLHLLRRSEINLESRYMNALIDEMLSHCFHYLRCGAAKYTLISVKNFYNMK